MNVVRNFIMGALCLPLCVSLGANKAEATAGVCEFITIETKTVNIGGVNITEKSAVGHGTFKYNSMLGRALAWFDDANTKGECLRHNENACKNPQDPSKDKQCVGRDSTTFGLSSTCMCEEKPAVADLTPIAPVADPDATPTPTPTPSSGPGQTQDPDGEDSGGESANFSGANSSTSAGVASLELGEMLMALAVESIEREIRFIDDFLAGPIQGSDVEGDIARAEYLRKVYLETLNTI